MDDAHFIEIILAVVAFLAAAGWAQTNFRISQKVNCDVCREREKTGEAKLKSIDERHYVLLKKIKESQTQNDTDHTELKRGIKDITANNLDTKIELVKIGTCLDKLYARIKSERDNSISRDEGLVKNGERA